MIGTAIHKYLEGGDDMLMQTKMERPTLSAKCPAHEGRGRPPDNCYRCKGAKRAFDAAKKQELREATTDDLTRAKGKTFVEDVLYPKKRDELDNYKYKQHGIIDAAETAATAEYVADYEAFMKMHNARMEPFVLEANAAREKLNEEISAASKALDRWKDAAIENLDTRCHILDRHQKECLKYLDYTGNCPKHGEIGKPGDA